jgi:5-bromo-4-chloroindolyl phosphate hydrolysis protein
MNYLDEFGLSDDDIKAIDEGIEEANKLIRALVNTQNNLFLGERESNPQQL